VNEGPIVGIIAGIAAVVLKLESDLAERAAKKRDAAAALQRKLQAEAEARLRREKEEREAREAAVRAEEIARLERAKRCREDTLSSVNSSLSLFELMTQNLNSADAWLDEAEDNFDDGAFAPFWDSIEKATKQLARFHANLKNFKETSGRYTELVRRIEGVPPEFPISPQSVARLNVAADTTRRLKAIVRKAQCDFQFATIYEQRKTNKILIAGFSNLAQALDGMTDQITGSINDLASSVSRVRESTVSIHERMGETAETAIQHNEEMRRLASDAADRERKALELLEAVEREYRKIV
jgi:methyl-accepting chemotaxis protein